MKKIIILGLMIAFLLAGCKTDKYKEPGIYAEIDTSKGLIVASLDFENKEYLPKAKQETKYSWYPFSWLITSIYGHLKYMKYHLFN